MERRYPYRPLVQLLGASEVQRDALARQAAQAREDRASDPRYRQGAVAHFAGFWADESEDGAGDQQKARPWGGCGGGWRAGTRVCALADGGWQTPALAPTPLQPPMLLLRSPLPTLADLRGWLRFMVTPPLAPPVPWQVFVGDFIRVDDDSSRSGYSVGQVAELYQDAAVGGTTSCVALCDSCVPLRCLLVDVRLLRM